MSPQTAELGLYWKNMWYLPRQKMGPLGSFIQFLAGRRWNWGRRGSEARLCSLARRFLGWRMVRAAAAVVDLRKWRRRMKEMLQQNAWKDNAETQSSHRSAESLSASGSTGGGERKFRTLKIAGCGSQEQSAVNAANACTPSAVRIAACLVRKIISIGTRWRFFV